MKKVQDSYFRRAKREGYAARSVYKLEQIDRKRRLLRPGLRVLDMGAAPGSWLQYAAQRVGPSGGVLAVDLQPLGVPLPPRAAFLQGDLFDLTPDALLRGGAAYDAILSDMAPKTSGVPSADAARSARLARRVLELSEALLRPGGSLLVKVFQGAQLPELRSAFTAAFGKVSLEKPRASRGESVEIYLLGMGKKG